jgi:hypothetical protein
MTETSARTSSRRTEIAKRHGYEGVLLLMMLFPLTMTPFRLNSARLTEELVDQLTETSDYFQCKTARLAATTLWCA